MFDSLVSDDYDEKNYHPLIQLEKCCDCGESHDYKFITGQSTSISKDVAQKTLSWLLDTKPSHRLAITKKMMLDLDSFNDVMRTYGFFQ